MTKIASDGADGGDVIVPDTPQTRSFVQGLVDRREAVREEPGKPLPSTATHVIVGDDLIDGLPSVRRVRFRAF